MDHDTKDESNVNNFLSQLNTLNKIISSFKETCKISSYCFDKCVSYPEKSLSNTNKKCIWNCTQRYLECDYFIKNRSKDNSGSSNMNLLEGVMNSAKLRRASDKSSSLMEQKGHFKEPFLYVEVKDAQEEKRQLYFCFVDKCFDHLLRQSDEYILATVKRNGSLTSFFFSHLLSPIRSYDLPFDRPEEEKETHRQRSRFDKHIFDLYIKLVKIYLNKDRRETSTIKSTFIKIHVFMDIMMMFHRSKKRKKEIKNLLKEAYRVNKINFLNINKYLSFLYEEVKAVKDQIGRYSHNKGNLQNLLYKINEFIIAVLCFVNFFHPFNYFDRNENKQTNDLILLRLMFYRGVDVGSFSLSTSAPEILKREEGSTGSSFLHLVVHTYFDMIHHVYEDTLKERARKDLLYLRHLFAQVLTMMVKYLLLYGNEKNKLIVVSIIIDMLKQTSEKMNLLYFLRNDMQMCNWRFLHTFVLKDKLDVDFYFYLNEVLKVNHKKAVNKMCEMKYQHEIERVMEITNVNDVGAVLKVLRRNNFDFCKAVEEVLATGVAPATGSDGPSDGRSGDGRSADGISGDGVSGDDASADDGRSDAHRSHGGSSLGRRANNVEVDRFQHTKPRAAAKGRQRNILDVLRERTRVEKPHKRKSSKGRYTNDNLGEENKNKIFDLLDRSSSCDDSSGDGSLGKLENDVLPYTSYRRSREDGSAGSDGGLPRGVANRPGGADRRGVAGRGGAANSRGRGKRGEGMFSRGRPPRQQHGTRTPDGEDGAPKGDGCSDGANRSKRYYMKKTTNKGKSHRRQYDRKMSRGML
ncbi:hypothetical protein AK88_00497 [Plasmodium fragile]|uniref:Tim10-like domain-containing protein n=1 Tax=Plasmodium fragile TaxID=5857 RepID=A0A0D9QRU8_PLAFR|nr:uncharacterized protein AK88_00497 [Plasmodium fragile]KJP89789.1 hypothetical protein AK88_00497 [Plasmodium fragile]